MHEFTNNFPEYGVLGNPDIPGPIELALYSADRGYSRKLGFREGAFSKTEELLFALPSPLIYYPLNERKPRACASPAGLPGVDSSWSTASLRLAAAAGAAAGRCADRGGCGSHGCWLVHHRGSQVSRRGHTRARRSADHHHRTDRALPLQPQPNLSGVLGSPGRHRSLRRQPVVAYHTRSSVGAHVLLGHPQRGALP